MTFEQLQEKVLRWADDKDLLHSENADKQFMKFIEEVFEFKSEFDYLDRISLFKDEVEEKIATQEYMQLEMGDIFVTLIILCEQLGIDPEE
nr:MazG-like family protein [Anaerococcus mediterraneensis]